MKIPHDKIFVYKKGRKRQTTVKRRYLEWRAEQNPPIPYRCDNPECHFYNNPNLWNGQKISFILDHIDGVNGNNRIKNLRFLCPNCNSQMKTHAGGNKNRVQQDEGGYAVYDEERRKHYTLPVETGNFKLKGGNISINIPWKHKERNYQ